MAINKQKALETLGISENDSQNEVALKERYRKLALVYHPDSNSNTSSSISKEEKIKIFSEINEAYNFFLSLKTDGKFNKLDLEEQVEELKKCLAEETVEKEQLLFLFKLDKAFSVYSSIALWLFFFFRSRKYEKLSKYLILRFAIYSLISTCANLLGLFISIVTEVIFVYISRLFKWIFSKKRIINKDNLQEN